MWVCRLDWAGPGWRQVSDTCECGNEPSSSVKCGGISWLAAQEGLCAVE